MENQNQNLLEQIEAYLKAKGFKQEHNTESPVFKVQRTIIQPGPTMSINGQQMKAPDQEIIHTVSVEFFGPGSVDDIDHFEIIRIQVKDEADSGKSSQTGEMMEGFYPEDLDKFKQMLARLV